MAQHNEASVEEILESIKKVIARDNEHFKYDVSVGMIQQVR